jgi:hypothetical protein
MVRTIRVLAHQVWPMGFETTVNTASSPDQSIPDRNDDVPFAAQKHLKTHHSVMSAQLPPVFSRHAPSEDCR